MCKLLLSGILYCYLIMSMLKKSGLLFSLPLLIVFFSCTARIDGTIMEGGAADLTIKTSLEPRTIALIRSLRGFMGEAADAPILDGPAISRSMAAAPGVRAVSLKNTGPSALEGSISISRVGDFLAAEGAKGRFITYTEAPGPHMRTSIVITMDRDSAPALISRLSPEMEEYLSALMAPVVLGEKTTRQEYLGLLTMVYGRSLADEIAAARIRAVIEFPRPVTVRGGTASGKRVEFDIPLAELLVLEQPLRYEVSW